MSTVFQFSHECVENTGMHQKPQQNVDMMRHEHRTLSDFCHFFHKDSWHGVDVNVVTMATSVDILEIECLNKLSKLTEHTLRLNYVLKMKQIRTVQSEQSQYLK